MKGNKPDFHLAMGPIPARAFYDKFVKTLRDQYSADKVRDGRFGALMDVSLVNDVSNPVCTCISSHVHMRAVLLPQGPVTIILDSETTKG
ncbi:hypothetical protein ABBQ38_006189 [Trebouxia sp. C0009 RCD-2024]